MNQNYPVTFIEALFLLFLGLKLAGAITWGWWIVFIPIYAPYILGFIVRTFRNKRALLKARSRSNEENV